MIEIIVEHDILRNPVLTTIPLQDEDLVQDSTLAHTAYERNIVTVLGMVLDLS